MRQIAAALLVLASCGGGERAHDRLRIASPSAGAVLRGAIRASVESPDRFRWVRWRVSGIEAGFSDVPPFAVEIESSRFRGGRHALEVEAETADGRRETATAPIRIVGRILPIRAGDAHFYSTFGCYNQRIVSNAHGLFATWVKEDGSWALERSIDGGATFHFILGGAHAGRAPVLETDAKGNVYLMHPDAEPTSEALFYRLAPEADFAGPVVARPVPYVASFAKFSMTFDENRGEVVYAASGGRAPFVVLDPFGAAVHGPLRKVRPGQWGPDVFGPYVQYPLLSLDDEGTLVYAWTSSLSPPVDESGRIIDDPARATPHRRHSVHFQFSDDGGRRWFSAGGVPLPEDPESQPVSEAPVYAYGSFPDRVELPEETNWDPWLQSVLARRGRVHVAYRVLTASGLRQNYVRYRRSGAAYREEARITGSWGRIGVDWESRDSGGFFVSDADAVYFVARSSDNRLFVLGSEDEGETWHDIAESEALPQLVYQIGGCRRVTADGAIVGMFADVGSRPFGVHFFRIPVRD